MKRQVSRLCEEIDGPVNVFHSRTIEGEWPHLWINTSWIVSTAVILAVGVDADGRREVLGHHRCLGGRTVLDRLPALARRPWPARGEDGD
ncbi:transposase [Microvirga aerilata]|uniref:Transposase n=1 Tax=Microvirga aerilata TaxID=670292 RepID=A0A936ZLD7_9HYPH|nr:transposase [Microvirga aerilata]